eukprot:1152876-Pelagomonas_calceolata.AAC.4
MMLCFVGLGCSAATSHPHAPPSLTCAPTCLSYNLHGSARLDITEGLLASSLGTKVDINYCLQWQPVRDKNSNYPSS